MALCCPKCVDQDLMEILDQVAVQLNSKTERSLNAHLSKADVVVLDYRNLTQANQQMVNGWINTLTPAQKLQILIVK
jgi:hypothetical protein